MLSGGMPVVECQADRDARLAPFAGLFGGPSFSQQLSSGKHLLHLPSHPTTTPNAKHDLHWDARLPLAVYEHKILISSAASKGLLPALALLAAAQRVGYVVHSGGDLHVRVVQVVEQLLPCRQKGRHQKGSVRATGSQGGQLEPSESTTDRCLQAEAEATPTVLPQAREATAEHSAAARRPAGCAAAHRRGRRAEAAGRAAAGSAEFALGRRPSALESRGIHCRWPRRNRAGKTVRPRTGLSHVPSPEGGAYWPPPPLLALAPVSPPPAIPHAPASYPPRTHLLPGIHCSPPGALIPPTTNRPTPCNRNRLLPPPVHLLSGIHSSPPSMMIRPLAVGTCKAGGKRSRDRVSRARAECHVSIESAPALMPRFSSPAPPTTPGRLYCHGDGHGTCGERVLD